MGGLAPILAGQYVARFASHADDFAGSMHRLTYAITFAGVMICVFYQCSVNLTDKELGDGPYVETDMSNLILVDGFMEHLGIEEVHVLDVDMSDGVLVSPAFWE